METLTIRLPDKLMGNLQKLSEEQNKPVSDIVRESIRRYVAVERFRALRKKVLPFGEAQGSSPMRIFSRKFESICILTPRSFSDILHEKEQ